MSPGPVRALVVDDEAPARSLLREMLAGDPEVEVVGEAATGPEAVQAIRALSPDLVFLDVQMPGLDGFGVVRALGARGAPAVVFVTAYDRYALDAFDADALDYLLKPFDEPRLRRALSRARARLGGGAAGVQDRMEALLARLERRERRMERLVVRDGERAYFIPVADVEWAEASGKYVTLHARGERHLLRHTLAALEERLDPAEFVRVHRSALVRVSHIREVQPWFKGDHLIVLRDGTKLTTGATYRDRVRALLGHGG